MMAPPAYRALQELSLIEIRQMSGVYSESAKVAVAGVGNGLGNYGEGTHGTSSQP
jgi:hypothetical protein